VGALLWLRSRQIPDLLAFATLWRTCHNDVVRRTTIVTPERVLQRLRLMAAERGTSMAELIREALEEKVASHPPRPRSLGLGASGHPDTAQRAGDERPQPRAWR
jgi:hypothetical protein